MFSILPISVMREAQKGVLNLKTKSSYEIQIDNSENHLINQLESDGDDILVSLPKRAVLIREKKIIWEQNIEDQAIYWTMFLTNSRFLFYEKNILKVFSRNGELVHHVVLDEQLSPLKPIMFDNDIIIVTEKRIIRLDQNLAVKWTHKINECCVNVAAFGKVLAIIESSEQSSLTLVDDSTRRFPLESVKACYKTNSTYGEQLCIVDESGYKVIDIEKSNDKLCIVEESSRWKDVKITGTQVSLFGKSKFNGFVSPMVSKHIGYGCYSYPVGIFIEDSSNTRDFEYQIQDIIIDCDNTIIIATGPSVETWNASGEYLPDDCFKIQFFDLKWNEIREPIISGSPIYGPLQIFKNQLVYFTHGKLLFV